MGFSIARMPYSRVSMRSWKGRQTMCITRHMSMQLSDIPKERHIAIVGGGLAGLSTAFHLLEKTMKNEPGEFPPIRITILDKAPVGTAGASSVAGGLLHPFSPRGKPVHLGMEGLESTNYLVSKALKYRPDCVLRDQLYRAALSEQHLHQMQETAANYPKHCSLLSMEDMNAKCRTETALGGLCLTSGKVIHVPSYLDGLWKACIELSGGTAEWRMIEDDNKCDESLQQQQQSEWKKRFEEFDTVVLSAGAGLIQSNIFTCHEYWPVQIVRGQSIEISIPNETPSPKELEAVLCGKYVTPLLEQNKMLIGATREFKAEPLTKDQVTEDLRERSYDLAPWLWDNGTVDKVTTGWRVQSNRGGNGRSPIIGRLPSMESLHNDAWVFTGLSSRGLIHHGVYGDLLTDAILEQCEDELLSANKHVGWWRKKFNQAS